jgi:hypothetical protein
MAQRILNVGSAPNAGDGEGLRNAMQKVNANFSELYSQVGTGGGGSSVTPFVGQVATRTFVPNTYFNNTAGWNTRTSHIARDSIPAMRVAEVNWTVGFDVEIAPTNVKTVLVGVEYPTGNFTRITWSGATSKVIASGETAYSDMTTLSVPIPAGATFRIWRHETNSVCLLFNTAGDPPFSTAQGDAVESSSIDKSMGGTIADNGVGAMVPIAAILGTTTRPSIAALGSSRMVGLADVIDGALDTGYARMFGGSFAYLNLSHSGRTLGGISGSSRLIDLAKTCATHLWIDPGLNDIANGGTSDGVINAINTLIAQWPDRTRIIINNEGPWTGQNSVFETKRAAINDYVASLSGINQFVNVADFVETAHLSGVWKTGYAADGVHENKATLIAIASAGLFRPDLVTLSAATGPVASNAAPLMDGTASPGSAVYYAREDHRHPTDTSRAGTGSPTFTGTPRAPTPPNGDNSTRIATTAFVLANGGTGGGGGGGGTQFANPTALRTFSQSRLYNIQAEFGGVFDGQLHPLSQIFANVDDARAAYPLTQAAVGVVLTDQQDWVAIQEAILTAGAAGGGIVALYQGQVAIINKTIRHVYSGTVRLEGFPRAEIRSELCGTASAIYMTGGIVFRACPLRNILFYSRNAGRVAETLVTPGVAIAGVAPGSAGGSWTTGTCGLEYYQCAGIVVEGVVCVHYDEAIRWNSDCWLVTHRDCSWNLGNKGLGWAPSSTPNNAGENMLFDNCSSNNNNYGIYIKMDPSGGSGVNSIKINGGSFDYNVVEQIHVEDNGSSNFYSTSSTQISNIYTETSGSQSGTNAYGFLQGRVTLDNICVFQNGGSIPAVGYFSVPIDTTWLNATNTIVTGPKLPLFYNAGGGLIRASGTGNRYIDKSPFILWKTLSGAETDMRPDRAIQVGFPETSGTYNGYMLLPTEAGNNSIYTVNNTQLSLAIPSDADWSPYEGTFVNVFNSSNFYLPVATFGGAILQAPPGKQATIRPRGQARLSRYSGGSWLIDGDLIDADRFDFAGSAALTIGQRYVRVFSSGAATITLPDPATCKNEEFVIKSFSGTNAITVNSAGTSRTVDEAASYVLNASHAGIRVKSTFYNNSIGWHWDVIAKV